MIVNDIGTVKVLSGGQIFEHLRLSMETWNEGIVK